MTHHGNESHRRRTPSSDAVRSRLEMRLQDLKRDWDAYKTGRSGAPRHRRSRSASSLPSSAVTVAEPDGFHLALLRRSPRARRLVSSLQQTGSADAQQQAPAIMKMPPASTALWKAGTPWRLTPRRARARAPASAPSFAAATPPAPRAPAPQWPHFLRTSVVDVRGRWMKGSGRPAGLCGSPPLLSWSWGS
jgi:hypothetical protein